MKPLTEMTNRELFCLLTGEGEIVQQTMLKSILLNYREKHPEKIGQFGEVDLQRIVAEMTERKTD